MTIRRITIVGAAAGALALGAMGAAGPASAADGDHTQTQTQNFHGTMPLVDINPCTGNPLVGSVDSNSVFHQTWFPGDDELWFTFTEEDKGQAVDTLTGVTFTGHDTVWGNENINRRNGNQTFTQTQRITGSDGSVVTYKEVAHWTTDANGNLTVTFDKIDGSLTCA
jgi:hypothetical protein